jgi:hypothetical protein
MAIDADAVGTPIPKPNAVAAFVNLQTGALTQHGIELLNKWYQFIVGMNRVIPCSATGTNTITLTPNDASPLIEKYVDYEIFSFAAAETSTGDVTATVVPRTGTLAELKVYKTDGAAQATTGDIVQNSVYLLLYCDHLDSGAGGFVLK